MLTPLILALLFNTLISPPPNPYIAPFSRTGPAFFVPSPCLVLTSDTIPAKVSAGFKKIMQLIG